jgi:hypothetical protein
LDKEFNFSTNNTNLALIESDKNNKVLHLLYRLDGWLLAGWLVG